MSIENWAGKLNTIPPYQRDEKDPYSLSIVLRVEKGSTSPTHEEALLTLAEGIANLFNDPITVDDETWVTALDEWTEGRIRKITRRARGKDWLNATIAPNVYKFHKMFGTKKVEILIFAPHKANEVPSYLKKLQVAGLDLEKASLPVKETGKPTLHIAFNPDVTMTTGKALAQIGHAVQLSILYSTPEQLTTWKDNGLPISLVEWDSIITPLVAVQDAGFTEVPPGTVTVAASF